MRKIILLSIFLFSNLCYSNWSQPLAITDSLSNNTNSTTKLLYVNNSYDIFLFWEKSIDSTSTGIYYKSLYNQTEEYPIVCIEGINFKNPQVVTINNDSNCLFYLFFETDLNEKTDIYYIKYFKNNEISEPIPFITTQNNMHHMFISEQYLKISWIDDHKLYVANIIKEDQTFAFSEPIILDSLTCINSTMNYKHLAWIKKSENEFQIKYINFYHESEIRSISIEDSVSNLYLDCDPIFSESSFLAWQTQTIPTTIHLLDLYDANHERINIFPNYNLSEPAIMNIPKVTKNMNANMYYAILNAFVIDTLNTEIFVNSDEYFETYQNVTSNEFVDRNPKFFPGLESDILLMWESKVNNNWQLFLSKSNFTLGSVDNHTNMNLDFYLENNFPNPFNNQTRINYQLNTKSDIQLYIYNNIGQKIRTLFKGQQIPGNYYFFWDGKDNDMNSVTSGIYFVSLESKKYKSTQKVLLVK